ncbi:hypothetical protein EHF11_00885 [Salmonella enterica subsp. enterica serovar Uzaramo]|nr:hypothetical protein [Salmonella enterica subsp. enterica serovar Uzaramo]
MISDNTTEYRYGYPAILVYMPGIRIGVEFTGGLPLFSPLMKGCCDEQYAEQTPVPDGNAYVGGHCIYYFRIR